MNIQKRGLGPISGPEDYAVATSELRQLVSLENATAEDRQYLAGLNDVIGEYHQFSFGSATAQPRKMLQYLLEVAKNITVEDAEVASGTSDLNRYLGQHRDLTAEERAKLALFFGVNENVFVGEEQ